MLLARYAVHISRAPASHKFLPSPLYPPLVHIPIHLILIIFHERIHRNAHFQPAFLPAALPHSSFLTPIKPFKHPLKSLPLHLSSSNTFHRYVAQPSSSLNSIAGYKPMFALCSRRPIARAHRDTSASSFISAGAKIARATCLSDLHHFILN